MEFTGIDTGFTLDGKVALVTGAAAGIGEAIATLFHAKGASQALVDLSDTVNDTAARLGAADGKAFAVTADVTSKASVEQAVAAAVDKFGRIDVLINNAGVVFLDDAENLSEDAWDKTMAVNLKGAFLVAQAVGRQMIRQGSGGKIINIASQAGRIALDNHVAYCTSKFGVIGMTKVLAIEWAEFGITVNSISPTVVLTELGKKAWSGEVGEAMKLKIPVRRFAYPEEIAATALFLATKNADMMTGADLLIDGGYTIQ